MLGQARYILPSASLNYRLTRKSINFGVEFRGKGEKVGIWGFVSFVCLKDVLDTGTGDGIVDFSNIDELEIFEFEAGKVRRFCRQGQFIDGDTDVCEVDIH